MTKTAVRRLTAVQAYPRGHIHISGDGAVAFFRYLRREGKNYVVEESGKKAEGEAPCEHADSFVLNLCLVAHSGQCFVLGVGASDPVSVIFAAAFADLAFGRTGTVVTNRALPHTRVAGVRGKGATLTAVAHPTGVHEGGEYLRTGGGGEEDR